ncbi:MAG: Holliday junction branch migration protein RuvA [Patescibacteria group bacterium]
MIYSIFGTLKLKEGNLVIVETGGVGFKLLSSQQTVRALPAVGEQVFVYSHLHVKEDGLDLYGFSTSEELRFFEMLISVSGVGPKSAIGILGVSDLNSLAAAIKEGRPDLLTRVSGVGRKTAERIIVELRSKVQVDHASETVQGMDSDSDILEMLVGLGYRKDQVTQALRKIAETVTGTEGRLKAALKVLSGQK